MVLLSINYLISLFPYRWDDDQMLAGQADADAAVIIVWLSICCLGLVGLLFVAVRPVLRPRFGMTAGNLHLFIRIALVGITIASIYSLLKAAPYYSG